MTRRRERRTPIAMPILMQPAADASGPAAPSCTLDLTSKGARVQLQSEWDVGELIWVERRGKRAQFRVVWVGESGTVKQGQIGIECLEPEFDWGMELPAQPDEAAAAAASADGLPAKTRTSNNFPNTN